MLGWVWEQRACFHDSCLYHENKLNFPPLPRVDPNPALTLTGCDPADAGLLIAIGPEGGWVEPDELGLLHSFGFEVGRLTAVRREIACFCFFQAVVCAVWHHVYGFVDGAWRRRDFPPVQHLIKKTFLIQCSLW